MRVWQSNMSWVPCRSVCSLIAKAELPNRTQASWTERVGKPRFKSYSTKSNEVSYESISAGSRRCIGHRGSHRVHFGAIYATFGITRESSEWNADWFSRRRARSGFRAPFTGRDDREAIGSARQACASEFLGDLVCAL